MKYSFSLKSSMSLGDDKTTKENTVQIMGTYMILCEFCGPDSKDRWVWPKIAQQACPEEVEHTFWRLKNRLDYHFI